MTTTETGLTHWKKNFNYEYLGSYSLKPGEDMTVTIERTTMQMVKNTNGKEEECFVCYFKDAPKPMVLNKTNCKIIEKVLGSPHVEDWVGSQVLLYSAEVSAFGSMVDALRVRDFKPTPKKDYTAIIDSIEAVGSLDELRDMYTALDKVDQGAFEVLKAKDKRKAELS